MSDNDIAQRELLVKKNSLSNQTRIMRTHVSDFVKNWFKDLPTVEKFKQNFKITNDNKKRREKDILYIQGQSVTPGSPQASTWSISSADCTELISSKTKLEEAKPFINEILFNALDGKQQELLRGKGKEKRAWEKELMYAPRIAENESSVNLNPIIPIHPVLIQTINYIPSETPCLGIFIDKNLEKINQKSGYIKWRKVPGSGDSSTKPHIWDWSSILDLLNINPDDPMEGCEDMMDFLKAMNNLIRVERARDPAGEDSPYGTFMLSHCNFFRIQRDSKEHFSFWKPTELQLRRERFAKMDTGTLDPFEAWRYELAYMKVKTIAENEKHIEEQIALRMAKRDEERKRKSYQGRDDYRREGDHRREGDSRRDGDYRRQGDYRSKRPFSSGNTGSSSTTRCLGCGERGHTVKGHLPSDPKFLWASYHNQLLVHPTSQKPICFRFNISGTSKGDKNGRCLNCKAEHVCSLCGKPDHHAFSEKCERKSGQRS